MSDNENIRNEETEDTAVIDEAPLPASETPSPEAAASPEAPSAGDTASAGGTETRSGFHPVNVGHLVMGLAFAGLLTVWALVVGDVVPHDDIRWLLPVPWLLGGAIGLVAVLISQNRSQRRRG